MGGCMGGWVDQCVNGWVNGWVTGWDQVKSLTRKPVGFMQSCCFVFNGNETKTCLLCNSYLFGMNNVLYIE